MQHLIQSLICLFICVSTAVAHPGHGNPAVQEGASHYLLTPSHLAPLLLATGLLAYPLVRTGLRMISRRPR